MEKGFVLFDGDLLFSFFIMAMLFLRQLSILKQPNKISYSPLLLAIGISSSIAHFILHPEATDLLLIVRESSFPLLVSLLLFLVMNILQQTKQSQNERTQHKFTEALIEQITQLKAFASELEKKMILNREEDRRSQVEIREKFKQDIQALEIIKINQTKFLEKFLEMEQWHRDVSKAFTNFTTAELPSLNGMVHEHIQTLRIAEQDHFNKLKGTLEKAVSSRLDITKDIDQMKQTLENMSSISSEIATSITTHTVDKLANITIPFEKQISLLKSHTEGIATTLYEGESKLSTIKEQSEMIMKQMILSSKKMTILEGQSGSLNVVNSEIKDLVQEIERIKQDYVKSQSALTVISKELNFSKDVELIALREQIEKLGLDLNIKIDDSLEKLHNHYHIANEGISKSVQFLAKQAQVKKGYGDAETIA